MKRKKLKYLGRGIAWTVYILECADKSYYTGMTRNLKKDLLEINAQLKGIYFSKHPERVPVKVVYEESKIPFREAYAKWQYLRQMNKKLRNKLIKTKQWPIGGALLEYIIKTPIENLE